MTPRDVLQFALENECTMVDVKFQDLLGQWRHETRPVQRLDERRFELGFGIDGAAVCGGKPAADLCVVPDPATARVDPFPKERTLHLLGSAVDRATGEPCDCDPRHVARKAEAHLLASGVADAAWFAPEVDFFVFDEVRFDQSRNSGFYIVDSVEGSWNSGRDEQPNLGYKPRSRGGALACPPLDSLGDLRGEMAAELMRVGVEVAFHRHGAATAGQGEIGLRRAPLVQQGDNLQWLKYVLKNVALRSGKTVTFMPKPLFEEAGSGLRVHQSLWKGGRNLFAGDAPGGLSELALWYTGGILQHAPALCALCNPSTNSYKRLVPGGEAPVHLAWSRRDRSAAVRLPSGSTSPEARRVALGTPDPSCSGHLAFAALLLAGLDGIEHRVDPGPALDALAPEELARVPSTPESLADALRALEADHSFLLRGGVFTEDALRAWVDWKREHEVEAVNRRPTPWEFALYYDS